MWMIGGLIASASDLPTRAISDKFNIPDCMYRGHMNDVWVFNPKGWTREQIMGDAANLPKYKNKLASEILPTINGYEWSMGKDENPELPQTFDRFRLYDSATDGMVTTVQQAHDEGWECTGIAGNWCRKAYLNRKMSKFIYVCIS